MRLMDAILEVPMRQVPEHVPFETKAVLLGGTGPLRPVYQFMLAREAGEWEQAKSFATHLRLEESEVGRCSGLRRASAPA